MITRSNHGPHLRIEPGLNSGGRIARDLPSGNTAKGYWISERF